MRIYIAGPMTGHPDFNYPAFKAAAAMLRAEGYVVENPAENPNPACKSWAGYMRMAIAQLVTCDAIYLLKGWEQSKGARIECDLARDLELAMLFQPGAATDRVANLRMWEALSRIADGNVMRGREPFSFAEVVIAYQALAARTIDRITALVGVDLANGAEQRRDIQIPQPPAECRGSPLFGKHAAKAGGGA